MRIGMGLLLACALAGCAQQGELRRPDGTMRASGQLRGGLQEGVWTHRHPDGSKQAEGPCKGDAQHGEWTWWRADGSVEQRGSFELGMKTGVWSTWRVDGSRSSSGTCHEGLEHGPWSFWRVDGSLERSGWYHLGSPAGPWTIHDASGAVKAFGHYQGGVMVGDWLARAGDGSWTRTTYPAADGVVLVVERARQATTHAEEVDARWLRRTGVLASGTKQGLWVGWHGGGSARLAASFVDDRAHGLVQACDSDGRVMAQGAAREGALAGTWRYAQGDGWRLESYDPPRPRRAHDGSWSDEAATVLDASTVERWLAELSAPTQPPPSLVAAPVADAATREGLEAEVPRPPAARAQPWTEHELHILPRLVELYGTGTAANWGERDGYEVARGRSVALLHPDQVAKPGDHLGKRLPVTSFACAGETQPLDLDRLRGRRNVLLVVLRGFGGQVCVYCTAQLKALGKERARLEALETEVCLVYPGPKSGLDAFLEAWELTFGAGDKPAWSMLYDADLELVDALGIRDNVAVPSCLLLDKQGLVRWSHVGKDHADRPSALEILRRIEGLGGR